MSVCPRGVGGLPQESILRILGPERGTGEDWLQAPLLLILDTCHLQPDTYHLSPNT